VSLIKASDEEGPALLTWSFEALSEDLSTLRVTSLANFDRAYAMFSEQLSDAATIKGRAPKDPKRIKKRRDGGRISGEESEHRVESAQVVFSG
jgi:hypothetical protein